MNGKFLVICVLAGLGLLSLRSSEPASTAVVPKSKLAVSIQPQHVADALRVLIVADQEVYTRLFERESLGAKPDIASSSSTAGKLPPPCEVLQLGSQAAARQGVEFSYVLRSLRPIDKRNLPETELEIKGLQFVSTRPDLAYTGEELLGGRWYFTGVYPVVARGQSCLACHNRLSSSTAKKSAIGDVMGGLVVRIALEL